MRMMKEMLDPSELALGQKIEVEHLPTYLWLCSYLQEQGCLPPADEFCTHISLDHLEELKDYYTRLVKMEKDARAEEAR